MKVCIPNESPEQALTVLREAKDDKGVSLLQVLYEGGFSYFDIISTGFRGKIVNGFTVHSRIVRLEDLGVIYSSLESIPSSKGISKAVKKYYISKKHKSWVTQFLSN
jgi:hypothetical protein